MGRVIQSKVFWYKGICRKNARMFLGFRMAACACLIFWLLVGIGVALYLYTK